MTTATLEPRELAKPDFDWQEFVAARGSQLQDRTLYRADFAKSPALGLPIISDVRTSPTELWAESTLTTPRQDLEGDVIDPLGVQFDDYAGQVLWEHGLDPHFSTPIAKAIHPNGMIALVPSAEGILCRSYFTAKDLKSLQIFTLIDEGLIRAMSIRATPVDESVRMIPFKSGERGLYVGQSMLREATWCKLGMNPDAVAKALDRGRINGDPIHEDLVKNLQPYAAAPANYGIGFELIKSEAPMSGENPAGAKGTQSSEDTTGAESSASTPDTSKSSGAEGAEVSAPATPPASPTAPAATTATAPAGDVQKGMDDAPESAPEDDDPPTPPGSQFLQAMHSSISELKGMAEAGTHQIEQEQVNGYSREMVDHLNNMLLEIEGVHDKAYADQVEPLSAPEEEEAADRTAKAFKSWLRGKSSNRLTMRGSAARLKSLATKDALSKADRETLRQLSERIIGMEQDAERAQDAEMAKRMEAVETGVKEMLKRVEDILPHKR